MTFPSYSARDPTFYILNGFADDLRWTVDIMRNRPHVRDLDGYAGGYGIKPRVITIA